MCSLLIPIKQASASIVPVETFIPIVETLPEYIIGLLEEMGVIEAVGSAVYMICQGYEYISAFIDAVNPFAITIDEIVDFFRDCMSSEMYFTDGRGDYYVSTGQGFRLVSSGDLYVTAGAVVNSNYSMPVNVLSVCNTAHLGTNVNHYAWCAQLGSIFMQHATEYYAVGMFKMQNISTGAIYYVNTNLAFTYSGSQSFESYFWHNKETSGNLNASVEFESDWTGGTVWGPSPIFGTSIGWRFSENAQWEYYQNSSYININSYPPYLTSGTTSSSDICGNEFFYNGQPYSYSSSKDRTLVSTYVLTDGFPLTTLTAQLPDLDPNRFNGVFVKVPAPPANLDPDKEYAPVTPEHWQIFKDLSDVLANVGGDTNINAGTSIGDYVNNNYLYNTVNVNLPDIPNEFFFNILGKVDMSLDVSGSLDVDINHGGSVDINVDVNINEDVSLPSITSSDGEGLIDMGVTDVIGGLTTHNPVFPVISSLFESIDPNLRALFITSVSLTILLALWKLIRG